MTGKHIRAPLILLFYGHEIPIGKGEILREGKDLTIIGIGPAVYRALKVAEKLAQEGLDCAVVNARYAKPLDRELIIKQCRRTRNMLTVEESSLNGGFGSSVLELLSSADVPSNIKLLNLGLPDRFIEHGSQDILRSLAGIDEEGIIQFIKMNFSELFAKPGVLKQNR
jgi:1-deoxy-D-xylulose-5-phosphate synthase